MSESTSYDNLIVALQKRPVTVAGVIKAGESFSRGALLGRLTATDQWQIIDEDNASSCNDFGIATEAIDTTAGATAVTDVFVEGEFNENAVIFSYSDSIADWSDTLQSHGIYLRKSITVAGVSV